MSEQATYSLYWATEAGLNPSTWSDETSRLVSASIKRGKDDVLSQIQPGGMTLTLLNSDGRYSPTGIPQGWQLSVTEYSELGVATALGYYSSPLYPNVRPMRAVKLVATYSTVEYPLFFGYIETISPQAARTGPQYCSVRVVDALNYLSTVKVPTFNNGFTAAETVDALINRALSYDTSFTWDVDMKDLAATVDTYDPTYTDQTLLAILQDLATHELGVVFIAPDGKFTFKSRLSRLTEANSITSQGTLDSTMLSLAAELPLSDIYNEVTVTYNAGASTATAGDSASMAEFGIRSRQQAAQWVTSAMLACSMAEWLLRESRSPQVRPRIGMINENAALLGQILGRDIGHRVTITEPTYTGINGDFFVEGVEHDIIDGGTIHRCTWQLSPAEKYSFWVLGQSGFSELSESTYLAF